MFLSNINEKIVCMKTLQFNKWAIVLLLSFLFITVKAQDNAVNTVLDKPMYETGKLYVKFNNNAKVPPLQFQKGDDPSNLPILGSFIEHNQVNSVTKAFPIITDANLQNTYLLTFSNIENTEIFIRNLQAIEEVEYVEKVPIYYTLFDPNDPRENSGEQWYFNNINAYNAWDLGSGSNEIVVAIIDDAVKITHEDLANVLWTNGGEIPFDGIDNDENGYVDDIHGFDVANNDNNPNPPVTATFYNFSHGTHVAGIAAANTDNNLGVASVGNGISIMALKCVKDASSNPSIISDGWEGIQYAIANDANVINISWGSAAFSTTHNNLINYAASQNIVVVAAAGNSSSQNVLYPAAYESVIAVTSSKNDNTISSFSNYGAEIDIVAPGSAILSCVAANNSSYSYQSGTSMAAPIVAGTVGLMLSTNPSLTASEVKDCLFESTINIDALNPSYAGNIGHGLLDMNAAISCVLPEGGCLNPYDITIETTNGNSALISWAAILDVDTYNVRYREDGTSSWTTQTTYSNSFEATGLSPCTAYEFQVAANCSASTSSNFSATTSFETNPAGSLSYCQIEGGVASLEWIDRVIFNTINNLTGSNDGYGNYVCTQTTVTAGDMYDLQLIPGYAGTPHNEYWKIWIDYNQDGDFDDSNELAFDAGVASNTIVLGSIVIPTEVLSGYTRMRVAMKWISSSSDPNQPMPCNNFDYGEVEDYGLYIESAASVCQSPTLINAGTTTFDSADISWSNGVGTSGAYNVYYRITGTTNWEQENNISGNTHTIGGLLSNTSYQCRVQTICGSGVSNYSSIINFNTQEAPCFEPAALFAAEVSTNSAVLNWNGLASNYTLRYRTIGGLWSIQNTSDNSYNLSGLVANTLYEFQVRSLCDGAVTSNYSTSAFFTTQNESCNTPYGINITSVTENTATISWVSGSGVNVYSVQFRQEGSSWSSTNTSTNNIELIDLMADATYEVRIRANCGSNVSDYSIPVTFVTESPICIQPTNVTTNNIGTNTLDINWDYAAGVIAYTIRYRAQGTSSWTTVASASNSRSISDLAAATTYEFQIRSTCNDNNSSFSPSHLTTTASDCGAPSNLIATLLGGNYVLLNWTPPTTSDVNSYSVRYRLLGNDWQMLSTSTNTQAISDLQASSTYEVQVRSVCSSGLSSAYTESVGFTTTSTTCPNPTGLTYSNVTANTATLSWANIAAAENYTVEYKLISASAWQSVSSATLSVDISGLDDGMAYHFRVKANCSTNFSEPIIFVTPLANDCAIPTNLNVTNIEDNEAIINWENMGNTNTYIIRYRIVGTPNAFTILAGGSSNAIEITDLLPNTLYEYQIKSVCSSSHSDYSIWEQFTTAELAIAPCNVPSGITTASNTPSNALISWNDNALAYEVKYKTIGGSWYSELATNSQITLTNLNQCTDYMVKIKAICNGSDHSDFSLPQMFTTSCGNTGDLVYCNALGYNANYEWIQHVSLGDIDNDSGSNAGYADFTNISTQLNVGQPYPLTLTPGFASSTYNEYWKVWVDLNQDGDFDDIGENIFDANGLNQGVVSATILIPPSAVEGESRMRVVMQYNNGPNFCGGFSYGEVEDYTVNIVNNGTLPTDGQGDVVIPILYCPAQADIANYEWIAKVELGSISNNSGSNGGYGDFTNISTEIQAGLNYPIVLTPGFANNPYNEYWRVWIDLNQDGDFDDVNELIFDSSVATSTALAGDISVPYSAEEGETRMRVAMKYNGAPTACGSFSYGEVEDYTVNIITSSGGSTVISYCEANGNNSNFEWIERVTVHGVLDNQSGSNDGYGDHTSNVYPIEANQLYDISLLPGYANNPYDEYWSVWIDFNQDGLFDNLTELVFDSGAAEQGLVEGNFYIPGDAFDGETRMRVAMRYKFTADPCGTFNYGEVEDYTLEISGGQATVQQQPTQVDCSDLQPAFEYEVNGPEVHFINRSSGNFNQVFWSFGDGELSEETSPTHIYPEKGEFYFSLSITDNNRGCSQSFNASIYITSDTIITDSEDD